MAGLLEQGMQQAGGQPQPAQDPMMGQPEMVDDDATTLPNAQEASPEEQQAYEQALSAVSEILYNDDNMHIRIMKMIQTVGEAESQMSGLIKATVTVITEVDKQIDIPEEMILNIADEVFLMIAELANKALDFDVPEKEMKQGIAATIEMLARAYGIKEEDWYNMASQYDKQQVQEIQGYMEGIQ